jgi:hypothetical protein
MKKLKKRKGNTMSPFFSKNLFNKDRLVLFQKSYVNSENIDKKSTLFWWAD